MASRHRWEGDHSLFQNLPGLISRTTALVPTGKPEAGGVGGHGQGEGEPGAAQGWSATSAHLSPAGASGGEPGGAGGWKPVARAMLPGPAVH